MNVETVIAAVLASAALVPIVTAITNRRQVRVDVAAKVNDMTLEWAKSVREEAQQVRRDLDLAYVKMAELRHELESANVQVSNLNFKLRMLRTAIFRPETTVEDIRTLVARYSDGGPS